MGLRLQRSGRLWDLMRGPEIYGRGFLYGFKRVLQGLCKTLNLFGGFIYGMAYGLNISFGILGTTYHRLKKVHSGP